MRLVFCLTIFLVQAFLYAKAIEGETLNMQPEYISAEDVKKLLTWPLVNEAVEEALKANGQTELNPSNKQQSYAIQPARSFTFYANSSNLLLTMPSFVGNYKLGEGAHVKNTLACKLVTSVPSNRNLSSPLPTVLANILLFNEQTGQLKCIMEGTQITAWRTAATSIVATKYLYFKRFPEGIKKPIKLAIIGTGAQGEAHALGMCNAFNVTNVYLYNRSKAKAEQLADKLKADFPGVRVHVCDTAKMAVKEADVVCLATQSSAALITYEMLKRGDVHINTVGEQSEVAQNIYDKGAAYVNTKAEVKGFIARGEIGEVIRNGKRSESERITIYKSMGLSATDATVAQAVYDAKLNQKSWMQILILKWTSIFSLIQNNYI